MNKEELYNEIADLFMQLGECFRELAIEEQVEEPEDDSEWGEEDE